jgi:hypothetical protein
VTGRLAPTARVAVHIDTVTFMVRQKPRSVNLATSLTEPPSNDSHPYSEVLVQHRAGRRRNAAVIPDLSFPTRKGSLTSSRSAASASLTGSLAAAYRQQAGGMAAGAHSEPSTPADPHMNPVFCVTNCDVSCNSP